MMKRIGLIGASSFLRTPIPAGDLQEAMKEERLYFCLSDRGEDTAPVDSCYYPAGFFIADSPEEALDKYEEELCRAGWRAIEGEALSARFVGGSIKDQLLFKNRWHHRTGGTGKFWEKMEDV